jgi:hypothetical protein
MLASSAVRNTPSSKHYAVSILADQHAVRHVVETGFRLHPSRTPRAGPARVRAVSMESSGCETPVARSVIGRHAGRRG